MRTLVPTLSLLALAFVGACGGGTTVVPPSLLNLYSGTYHYVGFSGLTGGPEVATGQWGAFDVNGAGTVIGGELFTNANGDTEGPDAFSPFGYTIDGARRLTWRAGGDPFAVGGISASGRTAMLASVAPGSVPAVFLTSRVEGAFGVGSLSGLYHMVLLFYNDATMFDVTHWGMLNFDGAGSFAGTIDANVGGTISAGVAVNGTYVVEPDGKVAVDYVAGQSYSGGMLDGGDLVIAGGSVTVGGLPALMVLVRGSAAATQATLNGPYHAVGITATAGMAGVPAWGSFTGTATSDGAGTLSLEASTLNVDGVISTLGAAALPYAVAADGTLDVTTSEPTRGGVSSGGDFAVLGGAIGMGDAPFIWFLLR